MLDFKLEIENYHFAKILNFLICNVSNIEIKHTIALQLVI